jgi:EmrB/QacA subfamily drug resistance transporter
VLGNHQPATRPTEVTESMSEAVPVSAAVEGTLHDRLAFLVLAVGVGSYALLQSFVIPVMSTIEHDLHASRAQGSWILTVYLLTASVATPIVGRIGDAVGKERVLVAALLTLGAGSVLAALAPNIAVMITARAIQGIGGGVLPLAFGIVRDSFPPHKVAGTVGALASLTAVAGGLGTVLAGPIVDLLDYHWLFWLPAIVVGLAAVAAHLWIPSAGPRSGGRISWRPAVLLSLWLVSLLLGLSQAVDWGWGSARVLGLFAAAVVLCVAWVVTEHRATEPLIDMRMMRTRAVWTTNLATLLMGVAMYAAFAFLPAFVQTSSTAGYGFSASIAISGLILLPAAATMFVFGNLSAPLVVRFGSKSVVVVALLIAGLSFVALAGFHEHIWEICVFVGFYGVGFGLAFAATASLIVDAVPPSQTGVASGMNANIRTVGGAIGSALATSIVTATLLHSGLPALSGYVHAYYLMAGACILAAAAGLLIPKLAHVDSRERELDDPPHPALAYVAAGTVVGDKPE